MSTPTADDGTDVEAQAGLRHSMSSVSFRDSVQSVGPDGTVADEQHGYAATTNEGSPTTPPMTSKSSLKSSTPSDSASAPPSKTTSTIASSKSGLSTRQKMTKTWSKMLKEIKDINLDEGYITRENEEETAAFFDEKYENEDEDEAGDALFQALKYVRHAKKQNQTDGSPNMPDADKFGLLLDEEDIVMLMREHREQKQIKTWIRFDFFFGMLVVINGVMEGLTTEGVLDGDALWVYLVDSVILVAFIVEWCVRWYYCPGGMSMRGFWYMLVDRWTRFDFVIIIFSALDLWVLMPLDVGSGTGMLAILRVVRLVRLIRLVRLLKRLRELWVLVSAMTRSMSILCWSIFLIVVVCYIFGLLMYEMVGQDDEMKDDPQIQKYWGTIRRSMLSLLQVATFDGCGDIIRMVVEGQYERHWLIIIFLAFIGICSLGVFNLMVGVLLSSALEVTKSDHRFSDATKHLNRHKALHELRDVIHKRCAASIGSTDGEAMISRTLLLTWMHEDDLNKMKNASAFGTLGAFGNALHQADSWSHTTRTSENHTVANLLQAANITEEDINSIFNEIGTIHGNESQVSVDAFIEGCYYMQSIVHPLHVTSVMSGLRSMHERLTVLCEYLTAVSNVLQEAADQVIPVLRKYHAKEKTKEEKMEMRRLEEKVGEVKSPREDTGQNGQQDQIYLPPNPLLQVSPQERELIRQDKMKKLEALRWAMFDGFFIFFVLLNGIAIGFDASREEQFKRNFVASFEDMAIGDWFWMTLEFVFFLVFTFEFWMRLLLFYQIHEQQNFEVWMGFFPAIMFKLNSISRICKILQCIPRMLQDFHTCFDVILLCLAAFDNFVLRFFFAEVKYFMVLRVFRGMRLLRLARLLYLFHDLTALIDSMIMSGPIVMWSIMMLTCIIYVSAIFLDATVREQVEDDPYLSTKWVHLTDIMLSLTKVTTLANWGFETEMLANKVGTWIYAFMIAFFTVSSLGVMNLVTGVVVQAAFRVVASDNDFTRQKLLAEMKSAVVAAKDKVFTQVKLNEERRAKDAETALKWRTHNYFRLWKSIVDEAKHPPTETTKKNSSSKLAPQPTKQTGFESLQVEASQDIPKTREEIENDIAQAWLVDVRLASRPVDEAIITARELRMLLANRKFMRSIKRSGLRPDHVVMLFQKLDTMHQGRVQVDEFIEGLQRMKQQVQGIDVAAAKSVMRRLYMDMSTMTTDAAMCHECFMHVVCELRGITVTGSDRNMDEETGDKATQEDDELMEARQSLLREENRRLRFKIDRVRGHIEARRRLLEAAGDSNVTYALGLQEGDEEDDVHSITSVNTGAD